MSPQFIVMAEMNTSRERVGVDVYVVYHGYGHGDEYVMPMAAVVSKGWRVRDDPCEPRVDVISVHCDDGDEDDP
jgi:hypothetical protein